MKKIKLLIAYIVLFLSYPKKMAEIMNKDPDRMDELVLAAAFGREGGACQSNK